MERTRLIVNIRPATRQDTPAMLELTSHIWEGEDYVPEFWDTWLADPSGVLVVAESQGRMAAFGRLARLSPDEWWLQGLRVHPEFEGRGVASQVHEYLVNTWRERFGGTLRLSTSYENFPIHHLCERTGFQKIGELSFFRAPAKPPDERTPIPFRLLDGDNVADGLRFIQKSPLYRLEYGIWALDWECMRPSIELLADAVQREAAWWWRGKQGLLAFDLDEHDGNSVPFIQHLACNLEDLPSCLRDYRRLAGHLGYAQAGWEAPLEAAIIACLEQAGFQRTWDGSIFIFAQEHELRG